MPRGHFWKDVQKEFDGVDGVDRQYNGAQQDTQDGPGKGYIGYVLVGATVSMKGEIARI